MRSDAVATHEVREASWVSAAINALTECQRVPCERPRDSKGRTAVAGNACNWRLGSGSPSPGEGGKARTARPDIPV